MRDQASPLPGSFEGRVAVVTGAGGGLGSAIALELASAGAIVCLLDSSAQALEACQGAILAYAAPSGITATFECDVTDPARVGEVARKVGSRFGKCDVLVNNAGVLVRSALEDHTVELWERVLAINLTGPFLCTQAFGGLMLAQGAGSIVNITSIAASGPAPEAAAYCASKAGLLALTRQTANEWGPRGVRANAVSPGFMRTAMTAADYAGPDHTQERARRVPVGRIGDPAEVARVVAFVAGDGASYLNGVDLVVDGGLTQTLLAKPPWPQQ